jgi:trimeric autotransporter adhesin
MKLRFRPVLTVSIIMLIVVAGLYFLSAEKRIFAQETTGGGQDMSGDSGNNTDTGGWSNTKYGKNSLRHNKTGNKNSALGYNSLYYNTSGNRNTALGSRSGKQNNGDGNVFLGFDAGSSAETGSNNIIIGCYADVPASHTSYHLNIGDIIFGDLVNVKVGIGTIAPGGLLGLRDSNTFLDVDDLGNLTFTNRVGGETTTKTLAELSSQFANSDETDPIYSVWDKSTGISITESQISDLTRFTNADETDPVYSEWDKSTGISITESQISDLTRFTNADETDPVYSEWDKSTGISITESQISDLTRFTNANEIDPEVGSNTTNSVPRWDGLALVTGAIYDDGNGNITIDGEVKAKDIVVKTDVWADFVFKKDYNLMPLDEVKKFIDTNSHLPEIPSEKEAAEKGISVGSMQFKLLQKVEELTLYVIDMRSENDALKRRIEVLEKGKM